MAIEPQPDIEAQLKAYAERRREQAGAPLELHPANRRMLQAEVARTYGHREAGAGARPEFWRRLWPRLALVSTGCGGLVLVAMVWFGRQEPAGGPLALADAESAPRVTGGLVAENETAAGRRLAEGQSVRADATLPARDAAAEFLWVEQEAILPLTNRGWMFSFAPPVTVPAPSLAPAPAGDSSPANAGARLLDMRSAGDANGLAARERGATPAPPAVVAAAPPAPTAPSAAPPTRAAALSGEEFDRTLQRQLAANKSGADAPAGPMPAPALAGVVPGKKQQGATAGQEQSPLADALANAASLRFVQTPAPTDYRRNLNSPPPVTVLNSFRMEQVGRQLRIIDEDGSTYVGAIDAEAVASTAAKTESKDDAKKAGSLELKAAEARDKPDSAGDRIEVRKEDLARSQPEPAALAQPIGQVFNFNVSGVNRTLNQAVSFNGICEVAPVIAYGVPGQPQSTQSQLGLAGSGNSLLQSQPRLAQTQLGQTLTINGAILDLGAASQNQVLRVQGRVRIGDVEIEINAVPAQR